MRKRLQPLPRCAQQPITRAAWRKHRPETDPRQASSQSAGDGDVLLHSELAVASSAVVPVLRPEAINNLFELHWVECKQKLGAIEYMKSVKNKMKLDFILNFFFIRNV